MNENCDADVAIDRAGYQYIKQHNKITLQVCFVIFIRQAGLNFGYLDTLLLPLMLLTITAKRKHYSPVFAFSRVKLRALMDRGPPSRVLKVRSTV